MQAAVPLQEICRRLHNQPVVYLLKCSRTDRCLTYLGKTTSVMRRWRQHNGEIKGGARRTTAQVALGHAWSPLMVVLCPTAAIAGSLEFYGKVKGYQSRTAGCKTAAQDMRLNQCDARGKPRKPHPAVRRLVVAMMRPKLQAKLRQLGGQLTVVWFTPHQVQALDAAMGEYLAESVVAQPQTTSAVTDQCRVLHRAEGAAAARLRRDAKSDE